MTLEQHESHAIPRLLIATALAAGCPGEGGGCGGAGLDEGSPTNTISVDTLSTTASTTSLDPALDSTGTPTDSCLDDYDGNHDLPSAFELGLDTTVTTRAVFGDQAVFGVGNEQGGDRLAVCPGSPDFFSIELACPGYLGIDLRRLGDGGLDIYLYADGVEVRRATGTWNGFFLKPLHGFVGAQTHTIEVRHAGGAAQPYSLDVYALPMQPCT